MKRNLQKYYLQKKKIKEFNEKSKKNILGSGVYKYKSKFDKKY